MLLRATLVILVMLAPVQALPRRIGQDPHGRTLPHGGARRKDDGPPAAATPQAVTSGARGPIFDVSDTDGDGVRIVLE